MLDGYQGTPEDFLNYAGTLLGAIDCEREKRVPMWRVAQQVAEGDWQAIRYMGVDRLFLAALHRDPPTFLNAEDSVDRYLPQTALVGIEYEEDKIRKARTNRRDKRVVNCCNALANGWSEDQAIVFVASKEEWRDAERNWRDKAVV